MKAGDEKETSAIHALLAKAMPLGLVGAVVDHPICWAAIYFAMGNISHDVVKPFCGPNMAGVVKQVWRLAGVLFAAYGARHLLF